MGGFVSDKMISERLPGPQESTIVLMCGPPPMVKFACQQNLDKLGYTQLQQVVFLTSSWGVLAFARNFLTQQFFSQRAVVVGDGLRLVTIEVASESDPRSRLDEVAGAASAILNSLLYILLCPVMREKCARPHSLPILTRGLRCSVAVT